MDGDMDGFSDNDGPDDIDGAAVPLTQFEYPVTWKLSYPIDSLSTS